jgi:serine/threonine protein kinase
LLTQRDNGEAVLADFELCKEATGALTETVEGTPVYMAAERKVNPRRVNAETDMYSVGVVLLLTFAPVHIKRVEEKCVGPPQCMADADGMAGVCDCAEHRAFKCTPKAVLQECSRFMPSGVAEIIGLLLSDKPDTRPKARAVLEGSVPATQAGASAQRGYFSQQNEETPAYWTDVPAHDQSPAKVVPITDDEMLAKLRRAIEPRMPHKFGQGVQKGLEWRNALGFEFQERSDGSCLLKDGRWPDIEIKKAWRLQNKQVCECIICHRRAVRAHHVFLTCEYAVQVYRQYSSGIRKLTAALSRGPPIESDELPVVKPDEIGEYPASAVELAPNRKL